MEKGITRTQRKLQDDQDRRSRQRQYELFLKHLESITRRRDRKGVGSFPRNSTRKRKTQPIQI